MIEDDLRAVMRAHDDLAPAADSFRPVVQRPHRLPVVAGVLVGLAAAAVAVVAGVGHRSGSSPSASHPGSALICPIVFKMPAEQPWVTPPAAAQGFDSRSRLVPDATPTHVTLCAYEPAGLGELTTSRDNVVVSPSLIDMLALAPPKSPREGYLCGLPGEQPQPNYLIGLVYEHASVWVSAPQQCAGATNGSFRTMFNPHDSIAKAISTGTWNGTRSTFGRLGQQKQLVPGRPDLLTIVAAHNKAPAVTRTIPGNFGPLVRALNAAPSSASDGTCSPGPTSTYELTFSYPRGPAVRVSVLVGCKPEVENGNIQIRSAKPFVPLIEKLLR